MCFQEEEEEEVKPKGKKGGRGGKGDSGIRPKRATASRVWTNGKKLMKLDSIIHEIPFRFWKQRGRRN